MVEINILSRRHDHIVVFIGCIDTTFFTTPAHYPGIWRQTAFKYLVPPDQRPSLAIKVLLHTLDKIALQFMLVLQSQLFHSLLTPGTFFPIRLRTFIASGMYVPGREEGQYFIH